MRAILLSALLLFTLTAFACLNETEKEIIEIKPDYHLTGRSNIDPSIFESNLRRFDSLWRANHNLNDYSDYGVALVYLGRYREAKDVFLEIEKLEPGRYATAANLGTVYELLGENENALTWIRKAVEISPGSHHNSEWIHVKILEAKIGGDHLITSSFLLNTSFGNDEVPLTALSRLELDALRDALYYQLNERVSFVKPEDKIVGLLLFELGNILLLTNDPNHAMMVYEKAGTYGFESETMTKRMHRLGRTSEDVKKEMVPGRWLKYGFLLLLMIVGIVIVVKLVANRK